MKTVLIIALICLLVGVLVVVLGFMLMMQTSPAEADLHSYTYSVDELPNQIKIDEILGDVEICVVEGEEWRVECKDMEKLKHTVELVDGVLTVKQTDTRKWYDQLTLLSFSKLDWGVTVYLPAQAYDALDVHSTSGTIKVAQGYTFFNANLKNTSGSILCNSFVEGDLNVKNTSGSIYITGGVGGKLEARTVSGSITVKGATPTRVTIKSTSGSIHLVDVVCQGDCEIDNTSSSIELERCDAASFDLRTVSGGIRASILSGKVFDCHSTSGGVHVPANSEGGTFKARTTSGGIRVTIVE